MPTRNDRCRQRKSVSANQCNCSRKMRRAKRVQRHGEIRRTTLWHHLVAPYQAVTAVSSLLYCFHRWQHDFEIGWKIYERCKYQIWIRWPTRRWRLGRRDVWGTVVGGTAVEYWQVYNDQSAAIRGHRNNNGMSRIIVRHDSAVTHQLVRDITRTRDEDYPDEDDWAFLQK